VFRNTTHGIEECFHCLIYILMVSLAKIIPVNIKNENFRNLLRNVFVSKLI